VRQQIQREANWQTASAARALLEAIGSDDEKALTEALVRAQRTIRTPGMDAWTAEKMELLGAVAGSVQQGAETPASYLLLKHLATAVGASARVM